MEEPGDVVQEFLLETYENLDQLDRDLVALEQEPASRDLVSRICRIVHTIKGTSGFLAFNRLEALTHAGESLLSRLRDGVQPVTPAVITTLLLVIDRVRDLLAAIDADGTEGDVEVGEAIAAVHRQLALGAAAAHSSRTPDDERRPLGQLLVESGEAVVADVSWALQRQLAGDDRRLGTILVDEGRTLTGAVNDALAAQTRRPVADSVIRVDVDQLDALMNLVGELVLVRNQLVRAAAEAGDPAVVRITQRVNLITRDLQERVMKTRMQPIDHLWSKLPRVVRDLSQASGKQVRLVLEGKETQLDRSLLEAVKDALTHLVRNAVDHGIEEPVVRRVAGKDPEGTLRLRAHREGGHVTLEVSDDGAGIDVERVRQAAVASGVVSPEQAAGLDPREVMMLVLQPGFSTAVAVEKRGVGMDVVKTNIERIGGAVDVESTPGTGTTWRLSIPLTLAIIQAVTVECAGERYVMPQVSVDELVFLDGQSTRVEYVAGAPVYRLRGTLLPVVRLDHALGLRQATGVRDESGYVVVLHAEGRHFGVLVDRVLNTEEIVVKSLTARVGDVGGYAGATILSDGKVALILDVPSLARHSHLPDQVPDPQNVVTPTGRAPGAPAPAGGRGAPASAGGPGAPTSAGGPGAPASAGGRGAPASAGGPGAPAVAGGPMDRLLVASVGDRRVAIPLDAVTRLAEFPADRVQRTGDREVVPYRGQLLPLIRLSHLLGSATAEAGDTPAGDTMALVIYTERHRSVALVVDRIVEIVERSVVARDTVDDEGLFGSAAQGRQRVSELLDVRRAIRAADPNFYPERTDTHLVQA